MVLGLSGMLVDLPASVLPVSSQSFTVSTELAYFSSRPGLKELYYFENDTEQMGGSCCKEAIELLVRIFMMC